MLSDIFSEIPGEKVEVTVDCIRAADEKDLGIAKLSFKAYVIPKSANMDISCRFNHRPIENRFYSSQIKGHHGPQV